MEPDEIKSSIGKKFLILSLWILAALFILAITAFILTEIKNTNSGVTQNSTPPPVLTLTETEKLSKLQNEEIDTIREEYKTQGFSQPTTTTQSQIKTIDTIRTKTLNQESSSTPAPKKTTQQQLQELDALRSATIK